MNKFKLSLIVPFYNEEINIKKTLETLIAYLNKNIPNNFELIFINDGSIDNSLKILKGEVQKYKGVKLITYRKNQGRGHALFLGFKKAKGSAIGYIDSDLEIKENYILKCLNKLKTYDVAIVSKHLPTSKIKTTFIRRSASKVYNIMIRLLTGSNISDHQGGLKLFKKEVLDNILDKTQNRKWLLDTELIYFARLNNFQIAEVPMSISYGYGKLQGSMISDFIKSFIFILKLRIKNGAIKKNSYDSL